MTLKIKKGTNVLVDAFDRQHVTEVLRVDRLPAVRRKFLGLI